MRKVFAFVLLAVLLGFTTACGNTEGTAGKGNLTFATGTTTGVYYSLGAMLSSMWTNELDTKIYSQVSNGSVENLNLMKRGEADLGFSTVNIVWEAYNGKGSFKDNPYSDVRILGNLYPNVSHIIARKGSNIKEISDIKGKNFVMGAAGSATEIESKLVLEAHGVKTKDVHENFVGFTEAVDLLRNKQVDAVNIYTGVPSSAATELMSTVESNMISFSDGAIKKLVEKYPWNFAYTIKANTYNKQPKEIKTVGQYSTIAVDKSVPDEVVYELTKILWENLEELKKSHHVANQFDPESAVEGTAGIPLHPGAEKYYKEIGVLD